MPKQICEDIEDVSAQIIEAIRKHPEGLDAPSEALAIGSVRMITSVIINLSRLADAAERIALALEDGVELQARIHGISR